MNVKNDLQTVYIFKLNETTRFYKKIIKSFSHKRALKVSKIILGSCK